MADALMSLRAGGAARRRLFLQAAAQLRIVNFPINGAGGQQFAVGTATMRPRSSTRIWSALRTVLMRCATTKRVVWRNCCARAL